MRPYQQTAIDKAIAHWHTREGREWISSLLLVLGTGGGKTYTVLEVAKRLANIVPNFRVLFIADQIDLLDQPIEAVINRYQPLFPWGYVRGKENQITAKFVVATIQTLQNEARLNQLLATGEFHMIVVDEAHCYLSPTRSSVLAKIWRKFPNSLRIGLTATPSGSIKCLFNDVILDMPLGDLITQGYAPKAKVLGVGLPVSIGKLTPKRRGAESDYLAEEIEPILNLENVNELVFRSWQKNAGNRSTVGFTTIVKHAESLAAYFKAQGVNAVAVSGKSPNKKQIRQDFNDGKIQVVFNAMLWNKGVDVPRASCIMMVRPTQSVTFYKQAIGRGFRQFEGKSDCLIMDFAPLHGRNLVQAADVLPPGTLEQLEAQHNTAPDAPGRAPQSPLPVMPVFTHQQPKNAPEAQKTASWSELRTIILDLLGLTKNGENIEHHTA